MAARERTATLLTRKIATVGHRLSVPIWQLTVPFRGVLAMVLVSIFCLLLLFAGRSAAPRGVSEEAQMQNPMQEKAGPYVIGVLDTGEIRSKKEGLIRGFLWKHWKRRSRGSLVATWYSKEGVPTTSHFFVEPAESGQWVIRVRIDRGGNASKTKPESLEVAAYIVGRLAAKRGAAPTEPIPESGNPPPSSYRLRLRDKAGKLLMEI